MAIRDLEIGEAYLRAAGENIQIHGGIGVTWGHDAHLYFKRATSSAQAVRHAVGAPRADRAPARPVTGRHGVPEPDLKDGDFSCSGLVKGNLPPNGGVDRLQTADEVIWVSVTAATSDAGHGPVSAIATGRRRRAWSWLVQILLAGVAIGLIGLLRDELPDLGAIWRAATHAGAGWLVVVVAAVAASMSCFARLQRALLRCGGVEISRRRVLAVTYASNALSATLPAGPAVSVVYSFRQWRRGGASASVATAVIMVGGIITTAAYSAIAMTTLLAEPHSRTPAALGLAALAGAAGALALLSRPRRSRAWLLRTLRAAARPARRVRFAAPLVRALADGLRQARGVVRLAPRDVGALSVLALLNWAFDILALAAACRALGIDMAPGAIAVAYFAAQAAGSLFPLLPGGLGAIEGGMMATLVALGAGAVPAGAAVGLYRVVSFWGLAAAGWLAWLGLWLRAAAGRPAAVWPRRMTCLPAGARRAAIGFGAMAGVATCFAPSVSASVSAEVPPPAPAPPAAAPTAAASD
jgi:uncharacterized protein (TIRG00374 family)